MSELGMMTGLGRGTCEDIKDSYIRLQGSQFGLNMED